MDDNRKNRILMAKILGEVYRIQRRGETPCAADEATIFGLLNGFEYVIDTELDGIGFVSKEILSAMIDVLNPIFNNKKNLESFRGFYDIEHELQGRGIDRSMAIRILQYLNANNQFQELIAKMDTSGSPSECRTFEISKWDS